MNPLDKKIRWYAPRFHAIGFLTGLLLLFFGCQGKPGDRDYRRALKEWNGGQLVRARASMEKALRKRAGNERNAAAYNQLGLMLWELNEPQQALDAFNASREISADRFDAAYNLGLAFLRQNNVQAAQSLLTEAALMRPLDSRPLEWLGQSFLKQKQQQAAFKTLSDALARNPNSLQIKTALALSLVYPGRSIEPAVKMLHEIVQSQPDYAPALFNLAMLYRHAGRKEEAQKFETAFIATAPETETARRMLDSGITGIRPAPASNALIFSRPSLPNRAMADEAFTRAFSHYATGEYERAFKLYLQAIEADDTYENAFYNLALTGYALKKLPEAKGACLETLALNPGNENARYMLALICYNLDDMSTAETHLHTVLQTNPDHVQAAGLLNLIRQNSH